MPALTGVSKDHLLTVWRTVAATGKPDKAATIMYALGWTQHSVGVQNIRLAAMIQLLLGNIGVAGGRERGRIHACTTCRHYLLVLDLVDSDTVCDVDLIPIRLVHLDAVAQAKGYVPLAVSAWNQFNR